MKIKFRLLTFFTLLALFGLPTSTAYAQGPSPDGGKVIFGNDFTLESGDTYSGDIVVFGGNVTIEEEAELKGNLVVFGGTAVSNGDITGDVVIVGGQVDLEDKAVVSGDVVTIGGQLDRAEGATVKGDVVNNLPPNIDIPSAQIPPEIPIPNNPIVNVRFNPFLEFGRVMGSAIFMAILGMLATLFFRDRMDRVSQAAITQPLNASSIGLLTIVVLFLVGITIILLPIALLGLIPLAFAWLFGIISIGQEVGERFAKALRQNWEPVITTGLGTFALVFIIASIQSVNDLLPFMTCVTWILPVLVGLLAVGAVVVTRFGARPVQTSALTVYSPPAGPPAPPAEQTSSES
jgi:cytoskeletal protein CcmA (bactofilin family)